VVLQQIRVVVGSVLNAPVGVMSQPFGRGPATESHLEGSDRQIVLEAAI
jgi:hypothetical protein